QLPVLTRYDSVKGIEPHRSTVAYTNAVQSLVAQVAATGLQSAEVAQQLTQLQTLSVELVNENPFAAVGKSGTLERIKNRMRQRVGTESAKTAFQTFWSQDYLIQTGWEPSLQFFRPRFSPCWPATTTVRSARTASLSIGSGGSICGLGQFLPPIFWPAPSTSAAATSGPPGWMR
ncbi:MAG: hypothetical protein ACKO7W_21625, partial [Elainella sp.]